MNKVLIAFVSILFVSVVGMSMLKSMNNDKAKDDTNTSKEVTKDNFKMTYTYKGDSKWSYNIRGTLPNPCYQVKVDGLVRESYPEQVSVNVNVTAPDKDMVCIQMIQEYDQTFEANVSEKATFDLVVNNK